MKPRVCVAVDGVLAVDGHSNANGIGEPIQGARQFMENLQEFAYVIVFSARCFPDDPSFPVGASKLLIENWLEEMNIPFDEVYTGGCKPPASAYVDDRAVVCRPQFDGRAAFKWAMVDVRKLAVQPGVSGNCR